MPRGRRRRLPERPAPARRPPATAHRLGVLGSVSRRGLRGFLAAAAARWTARRSPSRWPTWCSRCASCSRPPSSTRPGSRCRICCRAGWAARTPPLCPTTCAARPPRCCATRCCRSGRGETWESRGPCPRLWKGWSWASVEAGYYVGMCFAASEKQLYSLGQAPEAWRLFLLLAVTLPTIASTLVYYWSCDQWARHPLARTLALYALPQSGWRAVASSVNTEFRRIDKFATGAPGARVIVTDTWVMKVTTYRVHVAQQQDVHLTVTESQQHELSPDSNLPVQLLTIHVASASPGVQAFDIRLNSTEYGELCEKLRAPIRSAANVVIRQSLGDLFLETFASLVEVNPTYSVPSSQELEACIGCMQTRASVKLVKTCQEAAESECQQCYCRPMWCLTCMGKWFASRQDPQRPDTWLASRVPCPTCRARFCILDVCAVR